MNSQFKKLRCLTGGLITFVAGVCIAVAPVQAIAGTIIDLTAISPSLDGLLAINSSGQAVGTEYQSQRGLLYSGGSVMVIAPSLARPTGINDSGEIIGRDWLDQGIAYRYSSGTLTRLGSLGGSSTYAAAINASGQIVGSSLLKGDSNWHGFVANANGTMVDLGTLGGGRSYASDINASGQIVGAANLIGGNSHAFLTTAGGAMIDIGTLGGNQSEAIGINASGQIVGESYTAGNLTTRAFLYSGGSMLDLGTLGGQSFSFAYDINASGQIIGIADKADGTRSPFLYSGGIMKDLNTYLPANSGWHLDYASAINDSGQIVGTGTINGATHAFLLNTSSGTTSATPEPSSFALLGAGAAVLLTLGRKQPVGK